MKVVAVIPARLGSTRLARKVLREISGKPMLQRVYEAVRGASRLAEVIVATDSDEVMALCRGHGWPARMTSSEHRSGTERVMEVARSVDADVYVNVQGDEPLARLEHIDALLAPFDGKASDVAVSSIMTRCALEDVDNPNAVKVVVDGAGRALYFSRAAIPFDRDGAGAAPYWKHLGFYAYRRRALEDFCGWPESALERSERLEQLRFLDHGVAIHMTETPFNTVGVDTEGDLRKVEEILAAG